MGKIGLLYHTSRQDAIIKPKSQSGLSEIGESPVCIMVNRLAVSACDLQAPLRQLLPGRRPSCVHLKDLCRRWYAPPGKVAWNGGQRSQHWHKI